MDGKNVLDIFKRRDMGVVFEFLRKVWETVICLLRFKNQTFPFVLLQEKNVLPIALVVYVLTN